MEPLLQGLQGIWSKESGTVSVLYDFLCLLYQILYSECLASLAMMVPLLLNFCACLGIVGVLLCPPARIHKIKPYFVPLVGIHVEVGSAANTCTLEPLLG